MSSRDKRLSTSCFVRQIGSLLFPSQTQAPECPIFIRRTSESAKMESIVLTYCLLIVDAPGPFLLELDLLPFLLTSAVFQFHKG